MIQAEIFCNNTLIMSRAYVDGKMSMQEAVTTLQAYILGENINREGECRIRVRMVDQEQQ